MKQIVNGKSLGEIMLFLKLFIRLCNRFLRFKPIYFKQYLINTVACLILWLFAVGCTRSKPPPINISQSTRAKAIEKFKAEQAEKDKKPSTDTQSATKP